jgi:hypothetical protein
MATMTSDVMDALAHVRALPKAPAPARLKAVTDRWDTVYSMPMALLSKQEALEPTQSFNALKALHETRTIEMLSKHLSWEAIRRDALDNPTIPDYVWRLRVKLALNRRGDAQRASVSKKRKVTQNADSK